MQVYNNILVMGDDHFMGLVVWDEELIYHHREADIRWRSNVISAADKLNGIEWDGVVAYVMTAYRTTPRSGKHPAKTPYSFWTSWQDGSRIVLDNRRVVDRSLIEVSLTRVNGKWTMDARRLQSSFSGDRVWPVMATMYKPIPESVSDVVP